MSISSLMPYLSYQSQYGKIFDDGIPMTGSRIESQPSFRTMTYLQFKDCKFPQEESELDGLFDAISKIKGLTTLAFTDCRLTNKQVLVVQRLCLDMKNLVSLTLLNCSLNDSQLENLFYSIGHSTIRVLNISGNCVSDDVLVRFQQCFAKINLLFILNNKNQKTSVVKPLEETSLKKLMKGKKDCEIHASSVSQSKKREHEKTSEYSKKIFVYPKHSVPLTIRNPYDVFLLQQLNTASVEEKVEIYASALNDKRSLNCLVTVFKKILESKFLLMEVEEGVNDVFAALEFLFANGYISGEQIKEEIINYLDREHLNLLHCQALRDGLPAAERELVAYASVLEEKKTPCRFMVFDPHVKVTYENGTLKSPIVVGKEGHLLHIYRDSAGRYFPLVPKAQEEPSSDVSSVSSLYTTDSMSE